MTLHVSHSGWFVVELFWNGQRDVYFVSSQRPLEHYLIGGRDQRPKVDHQNRQFDICTYDWNNTTILKRRRGSHSNFWTVERRYCNYTSIYDQMVAILYKVNFQLFFQSFKALNSAVCMGYQDNLSVAHIMHYSAACPGSLRDVMVTCNLHLSLRWCWANNVHVHIFLIYADLFSRSSVYVAVVTD